MDLISDKEHALVCEWVHQHIGVKLDKDKKYLIETRLEPVAFEYGFGSLRELLKLLASDQLVEYELRRSIYSAITTHETSFFRDHHPFLYLKEHFLPEFFKRRSQSEELAVWSCACSSGQEVYSIAILLCEHFQHELKYGVSLHATDICYQVLEKASKGIYTQNDVTRGLHASLLVKYFEQTTTGSWGLKDVIQDLVSFEYHNLIQSWSNIKMYDVIFLRNVLIYFDLDLKRRILDRLKRHLKPGGVLFLGGSESAINLDPDWSIRTHKQCVYYQLD